MPKVNLPDDFEWDEDTLDSDELLDDDLVFMDTNTDAKLKRRDKKLAGPSMIVDGAGLKTQRLAIRNSKLKAKKIRERGLLDA